MTNSVETRLKGTRRSYFVREFFTNSAYFPLVNIVLELLLNDPFDYLVEPDPYLILAAALVQAWVISRWSFHGRAQPLLGNLIGPLLYTFIEVGIEGNNFTATANHLAYWCFALAIGGIQQLRLLLPLRYSGALILLENLLRTSILLVMYTILEFLKDDYASLGEFLADSTHLFVVITIPFIGLLSGFANINAERYLAILRGTAGQLQEYSEWLLGKELLAQAVLDPQVLSLSRHERVMLFMDIRGFTAWSEGQEPEQVVALMNGYYEAAEPVWRQFHAIKVKFTADEILLVFAGAAEAVSAARALLAAVAPLLQGHGLSVGLGVHCGPVVEGIMGASDRKGYDLLGDSVNTAKRLCDNALGGEILLSQAVVDQLTHGAVSGERRSLLVKGKQQPLSVTVIT
jgi:class 3 adenylate cyclase